MRTYNFSAGPTRLPLEVVARIREELPDWGGTGMSVFEMPFSAPAFTAIAERAREDLAALLGLPVGYHVLFMHGGACGQFAAVPLNLTERGDCAAFVDTGYWSRKALAEARRYCNVHIAARTSEQGLLAIPPESAWDVPPRAAYCHLTSNETADGLQYAWTPTAVPCPLVADMSSDFLSRPVDVRRYGILYAAAQKNIGPAGLAVVIVREDLLGRARAATPGILDYRAQVQAESFHNTPATFAIYVAGLVLQWIRDQGGLAAMAAFSVRRSRRLYDVLDASAGFYRSRVAPHDRSCMNVCFGLAEAALEERFVREAEAEGLLNLRGHARVGGLRASLYNAMPLGGVEALASFMREFERRHG
jgi:phosphoserine aminotransferase